MTDTRGPLPLETVRDLLGIVRAWYASAKNDHGVGRPQLRELAEIGRLLRLAVDLAQKTRPDTIGHRASWEHAEEATRRLMALVMELPVPAGPIVEAAVIRFRKRPQQKPSEREERRAAERTRR